MEEGKSYHNPVFGIFLMCVAVFMFTVMNVLAKFLSDHMHVVEIGFYRSIFGVLPFIVLILMKDRNLFVPKYPKWLLLRGLAASVGIVITFGAYALLPVANVTALLFSMSLTTPILAFFILHEKIGIYRIASILFGFVGVLFITKPSLEGSLLGVILAIVSVLLISAQQILLRHIGQKEHPLTTTFYLFLAGVIFIGPVVPFLYSGNFFEHIYLVIGVGAAAAIAQFFFSAAHRYAESSLVAIFNYSGIIWAVFFGWLIWRDWPTMEIWVGSAIVIASNLFIFWREKRKSA